MWRMTSFTRAATLLLIAMAALPVNVLAQKSNLLVTAAVSPRPISHDSLVHLKARIQNDHWNRAIVLRGEPGWTTEGGVTLRVTDASGNARAIATELGGLSADEARNGSRKLVLNPGEGVSLTRQVAASQLFQRPGTYTVVVSYRSPQSAAGQRQSQRQSRGSRRRSRAVGTDHGGWLSTESRSRCLTRERGSCCSPSATDCSPP